MPRESIEYECIPESPDPFCCPMKPDEIRPSRKMSDETGTRVTMLLHLSEDEDTETGKKSSSVDEREKYGEGAATDTQVKITRGYPGFFGQFLRFCRASG